MTSYNHILDIQPEAKRITVQAGATWADVQRAINPYGLSLKNMQSQNIFTVGGSISVNAHGRELRNGSLIQSVESFRLLTADGQIREVSRTSNSELFPLVLGGYGLFGLILDVTLTLTDDELYQLNVDRIQASAYPTYFRKMYSAIRTCGCIWPASHFSRVKGILAICMLLIMRWIRGLASGI